MSKKYKALILAIMLYLFSGISLFSQVYPASPSNWLFPYGNSEGTRHQRYKSRPQVIDSIKVKWATKAICGDVQPLIGNIINNPKINNEFPYAPNEIVAVVGNRIIVVDALGRTYKLPQPISFLKSATVLYDTLATKLDTNVRNPVVIGLELVEYENVQDSLMVAYVAGWDDKGDTVALIQRLAIDLRDFKEHKNIFGSIKPVFGRKGVDAALVYATINMSKPNVLNQNYTSPPFFRGFSIFDTRVAMYNYPMPDIGDVKNSRLYYAPEVNSYHPSISFLDNGRTVCLLPCYQTPTLGNVRIEHQLGIIPTYANKPYLFAVNLDDNYVLEEEFAPYNLEFLFPTTITRPIFRPIFTRLHDGFGETNFILLAEEYTGLDGSTGRPRLHLFTKEGNPITFIDSDDTPPFHGGQDHLWSIAVGNVDGTPVNNWTPYYPHNVGREIIVTQSTRDLAYPNNRIYILRYMDNRIPKTSPPDSYLFKFDTICSQRINGWVAAVNDLDNGADNKDEIIIVDGSILRILRLRDYATLTFRSGLPFDTLFTYNFNFQMITSVAVADLEGDGLNDIIVTTSDSLYVLGTILPNEIKVVRPKVQIYPPEEYCAGDVVKIRWANIFKGRSNVNILFSVYQDTIPTGEIIPVALNYENLYDTVEYNYVVKEELLSKQGRFIIESIGNPGKESDSTAILRFVKSAMTLSPLPDSVFRIGDVVNISGEVVCVDSILFEYSIDNQSWIRVGKKIIYGEKDFDFTAVVPCVPIFDCLASNKVGVIFGRLIYCKYIYADTSASFPIRIAPIGFNVRYEQKTVCPSIEFSWQKMFMPFSCDSIVISYKKLEDEELAVLAVVAARDGKYVWQIPIAAPDSLMFSFCCMNSCQRIDTVLSNLQIKYVDIIAPNPFNPILTPLEIVYKVYEETRVSIRIIDQANKIVAEPVVDEIRYPNQIYCDKWDGKLNVGCYAANGAYYLLFELPKGKKEVHLIFVKK